MLDGVVGMQYLIGNTTLENLRWTWAPTDIVVGRGKPKNHPPN